MPELIELRRSFSKISVVCPFYNEELIIEKAAAGMVKSLGRSGLDWELILVNDGSTDNGLKALLNTLKDDGRVKIISYDSNKGRGYALKTGINAAKGDIIVTTEVDLSWGEDIVRTITDKFRENPKLDMVIASPNLKGGAYRNIPLKRVLLSKTGNQLIRLLFTRKVTMNTGMTRGYRKEIIQGLNIFENGKEFHLEVLLKLYTLGAEIGEVPAVLEWKDSQLARKKDVKRVSSLKIFRTIGTHLNFMFFASPIKYFWFISFVLALSSFGAFLFAVYLLLSRGISVYMAIISLLFAIFGLLFFGFGVIAELNKNILKELWSGKTRNSRG